MALRATIPSIRHLYELSRLVNDLKNGHGVNVLLLVILAPWDRRINANSLQIFFIEIIDLTFIKFVPGGGGDASSQEPQVLRG